MVTNNFILIGANSEFATTLAEALQKNKHNVYGVSRNTIPYLNKNDQIQLKDYIENSDDILKFIEKINNPYIIFFNGFLAENRPKYSPNYIEIEKTIKANYLIPFNLTNKIHKNMKVKKFIYISSMAAVKPRFKNYIYGQSKKSLEESIIKNKDLNYLILRFGQIKTKMSENHKQPPFTLSKEEASLKLMKSINKKGITYPTIQLLIMALFIKFVPKNFIDKLEEQL